MLKYLSIGEELYFTSELVRNHISGCVCIVEYNSVSITLRHYTLRSSTFSSFSQDLKGS